MEQISMKLDNFFFLVRSVLFGKIMLKNIWKYFQNYQVSQVPTLSHSVPLKAFTVTQ